MPLPGYNEADTRAKLIDPALHAAAWIERVGEAERATHGEIHREQSAVRIEILDGKPLKRGRGRVDYLLRAFVGEHEHPLTLAFVEAKKEKLPPTLMYAFMASFHYLRELGSGSVHKTIYMPTIESFQIQVPVIDEQRRIARTLREQLAAAESLRTRLAERQAEIERLPQRILAAAFGDAA